jgi:hypothetical protein
MAVFINIIGKAIKALIRQFQTSRQPVGARLIKCGTQSPHVPLNAPIKISGMAPAVLSAHAPHKGQAVAPPIVGVSYGVKAAFQGATPVSFRRAFFHRTPVSDSRRKCRGAGGRDFRFSARRPIPADRRILHGTAHIKASLAVDGCTQQSDYRFRNAFRTCPSV